jgi:hypothetical protein
LSFLYTSPPPKKQTSHFHCPSDSWKSWVQTKSKYLHKWTKRGKRRGKQRRKAPQGRDKEVVIGHIFVVVYLGSWRWQKCKQSVTNEHK